MRICALGDLLLDVVVRLDHAIAPDTDAYGTTHVGAGGQAANVAAWAVELGAVARFIGARATDRPGRLVAEELQGRGVDLVGPELEGRTGVVVSVASPDGRRTMLTDRGVAPEFAPTDLDESWIAGCDWLHVTGYSLVRSPLRETAIAASALAERVSLDLSSTVAISQAGVERFRETLAAVAPALVLGNEEETELVGDVAAETTVIKRGARGCTVRVAGQTLDLAARPALVVDTTGAGDAFAAGFLATGPELGLDAAARCVAKLGAMP